MKLHYFLKILSRATLQGIVCTQSGEVDTFNGHCLASFSYTSNLMEIRGQFFKSYNINNRFVFCRHGAGLGRMYAR